MDHSQFYMTSQDYELSALRRKIDELEKELRKLKGIEEPEQKPQTPQTFKEVVMPGIEKIFDEVYGVEKCSHQ